jgi:hypothetical protein
LAQNNTFFVPKITPNVRIIFEFATFAENFAAIKKIFRTFVPLTKFLDTE